MKNLITTSLLIIILKFSALGQCNCYTAHEVNIVSSGLMELILSNTCDNNVYLNFYVISTIMPFDTLARQDNFGGAILPLNTNVSSLLNTNLTTSPAPGTYRVSITNGTLICDSIQFSNTVGITDIQPNNPVHIYPNPVSSTINLQSEITLQNATLTIYNSLGQVVKQIINISGQEIVLHIESLLNGVYFVHLNQENKVIAQSKMVIKN